MKNQIIRAVLTSTIALFSIGAQASLLESFYGAYQVAERTCQSTDVWCPLMDQIVIERSSFDGGNAISLTEVGSNKNRLVNHLMLKPFRATSPTGMGLQEAYFETNQKQVTWESIRFVVDPKTGASQDVYREVFSLSAEDGYVHFEFENQYILKNGLDQKRVLKLIRIK